MTTQRHRIIRPDYSDLRIERCPTEIKRAIKVRAAQEGVTMAELVVTAVQQYIDKAE